MTNIGIHFLLLIACSYLGESIQPYFPSQITFSPDNGRTVIAIDEINQQAYQALKYGASSTEITFAMQHIPYALPDSPQSKYYVQLLIDSAPLGCMYGTYWKYGGNTFNSFPAHWLNGSSFEIKSYNEFKYSMIYSNTSSSSNEDYWHADTNCQIESGQSYPCEEIYFKKNTEIPLRYTRVVRRGWIVVQEVINYEIISMGKPDSKLFDSIPQNWAYVCRDVMLGLLIYPQSSKLSLNQSVDVQIWLITPPHRIDGNDTVRIQWKPTQCKDCLKWGPEQLLFNTANFQERQTIKVTRVKDGPQMSLIPTFIGGGFDTVIPDLYPIYIQ